MEKVLEQKKIFNKKKFIIQKDRLNIEEKSLFKVNNYSIPYENLHTDPHTEVYVSKLQFWFTFIFGVVLFALSYESLKVIFPNIMYILFYVLVGVLGLVSFWISKEEWLLFSTSGDNIIVLQKKPSKKAVDEFVKELSKAKDEFMENYFSILPTNVSRVDELYKLFWLKKQGMVNEEEFNTLKAEIMKKSETGNNIISSN